MAMCRLSPQIGFDDGPRIMTATAVEIQGK